MHKSLKYAAAAAVGVAVLEYIYTTDWYQKSTFYAAGGVQGIAFDLAVAGGASALVGLAIG